MILLFILLNGFLYALGRNVVYNFTAPRRDRGLGRALCSRGGRGGGVNVGHLYSRIRAALRAAVGVLSRH